CPPRRRGDDGTIAAPFGTGTGGASATCAPFRAAAPSWPRECSWVATEDGPGLLRCFVASTSRGFEPPTEETRMSSYSMLINGRSVTPPEQDDVTNPARGEPFATLVRAIRRSQMEWDRVRERAVGV